MEIFAIALVLGLLYVGAAVLGHFISKSPTFGTKCPLCSIRGQITKKEIDRDYLGNVTKRDDGLSSLLESKPRFQEYKRYMVTFMHQCGACGKNWTTSTERLSEDSLANLSKALGGFDNK